MAVFSCASFGADDQKPSRPPSFSGNQFTQPNTSSEQTILTSPSVAESRELNSGTNWKQKQAWVVPLNASNDVCYTLRTYKVRRTERLSDNENGQRSYTTCQFAVDFQFRSADARVEESTPPAKK
jgi:hypothetical protein